VGLKSMGVALEELTTPLNPVWISEWTVLEAKAMKEWGDSLNIYEVSLDKGKVPMCIEKLANLFPLYQLRP
jgi:hypothetical protein